MRGLVTRVELYDQTTLKIVLRHEHNQNISQSTVFIEKDLAPKIGDFVDLQLVRK